MAFNDQNKAAFDYAQESTKQLITLSTGIIALMVTFLSDVIKAVPAEAKPFAQLSWLFYLISVIAGLGTLLALTGSLTQTNPSINGWNVRLPAIVQILTFIAGLVLTLWFGFVAMK